MLFETPISLKHVKSVTAKHVTEVVVLQSPLTAFKKASPAICQIQQTSTGGVRRSESFLWVTAAEAQLAVGLYAARPVWLYSRAIDMPAFKNSLLWLTHLMAVKVLLSQLSLLPDKIRAARRSPTGMNPYPLRPPLYLPQVWWTTSHFLPNNLFFFLFILPL